MTKNIFWILCICKCHFTKLPLMFRIFHQSLRKLGKSWDSIDQSPLLLRGSNQYWCPSRQRPEKIIEVLHLLESILQAACCPVRIRLYLKRHHSPIEAKTHRLLKKINKTTNTIFNLFPSWILKGKKVIKSPVSSEMEVSNCAQTTGRNDQEWKHCAGSLLTHHDFKMMLVQKIREKIRYTYLILSKTRYGSVFKCQ